MDLGKETQAKRMQLYKDKLLSERETLNQELKDLNEGNLEVLQSEMSGETANDEHTGDSGTATFERERDLTLENNIKDLLGKIDAAIVKMDKGTYGECDTCGQTIDPARLKAVPYANMCIKCKTEEENKR
jgi:RNA polymerase-binding protein DksA